MMSFRLDFCHPTVASGCNVGELLRQDTPPQSSPSPLRLLHTMTDSFLFPRSRHEKTVAVPARLLPDRNHPLYCSYDKSRARHLPLPSRRVLVMSSLGVIARPTTRSAKAPRRLAHTHRSRTYSVFDDGVQTGLPPIASPTTRRKEYTVSSACAWCTRARNHSWTSSSSMASAAVALGPGAREQIRGTFGRSAGFPWKRGSRMLAYRPSGTTQTWVLRSKA